MKSSGGPVSANRGWGVNVTMNCMLSPGVVLSSVLG